MKKYATKSTNRIILLFIIKSILCSFLSLLILTMSAAKLMLLFDISGEYYSLITVVISLISAAIVSLICNIGEKSRGVILGIMSTTPIIIFSLFNLIFCDNTFVLFLFKIILVTLCGGLFGLFSTKGRRKVKIK